MIGVCEVNVKAAELARLKILLIQLPGDTVLGVLYFEAGSGEGIANLVAGSPVLGSLGLGAQVEYHIDDLAISLLAGFATCSLPLAPCSLQSEDVLGKEVHHLTEFLQAVGTDGGLVVDELVDDGAGPKRWLMTCGVAKSSFMAS